MPKRLNLPQLIEAKLYDKNRSSLSEMEEQMSTNQAKNNVPYKTYLSEDELPTHYYNVRADMKTDHAPILHPGTLQPVTVADMEPIFCTELAKQELNTSDKYIEIPDEVRSFYRMYRPSPVVRAYYLEKALGTPARIYYKYEGGNTSGSHKLNSAIAQAYYAKQQGLTGLTTETGAGQWGSAMSMACVYFDLDLMVYMVKVSSEQKPYRKTLMETYGAKVIPSPSETTEVGRRILQENPGIHLPPNLRVHHDRLPINTSASAQMMVC